ncbi:MAG: phosphatidate cytidylyltransferase [bacterium]|nr:phosphatidate cytidylyltransferase [bacterium]
MEKLNKSNLFFRLLTSFAFVPFFLAIFDFGSYPFLFLILGIIGIMAYEFFYLLRAKKLNPYFKVGVFSSVILGFIMYYSSALFTYFLITFLIMLVTVGELRREKNGESIIYMSSTTFGVIYTGWLGGHMLLVRQFSESVFNSGIMIYLPFLMIWMADTGAFFLGSLIGKHKIIPRISPSKSYEGLIGGLIFSFLSGFAFMKIWAQFLTAADILILSIIAVTAGLAGDLVESAMKRDANIKDISSFLPGHGGVLDRFDSILFALPLFYYYFVFILKSRLV